MMNAFPQMRCPEGEDMEGDNPTYAPRESPWRKQRNLNDRYGYAKVAEAYGVWGEQVPSRSMPSMSSNQGHHFNEPPTNSFQEPAMETGQRYSVSPTPGFPPAFMQGKQNYSQHPVVPSNVPPNQRRHFDDPVTQYFQEPAMKTGRQYSGSPTPGDQGPAMQGGQQYNMPTTPAGQSLARQRQQYKQPATADLQGPTMQSQQYNWATRSDFQSPATQTQEQYINNPPVLRSNAPPLPQAVFRNTGQQSNFINADYFGQAQIDPFAYAQVDPFAQVQEDIFAQVQSDHFAQVQGDPFPQVQEDLFAQAQGGPFTEARSRPFHQVQADPFAQTTSDLSPHGQNIQRPKRPESSHGHRTGSDGHSSFGHTNMQSSSTDNGWGNRQTSNKRPGTGVHPYSRPTTMQSIGNSSGQRSFQGASRRLSPGGGQQDDLQTLADENNDFWGSWPLPGNLPASGCASPSLGQQGVSHNFDHDMNRQAPRQEIIAQKNIDYSSSNDRRLFPVTTPDQNPKKLKFAPAKSSRLRAVTTNFGIINAKNDDELIFVRERQIPPSKEEAARVFDAMICSFPAPKEDTQMGQATLLDQADSHETRSVFDMVGSQDYGHKVGFAFDHAGNHESGHEIGHVSKTNEVEAKPSPALPEKELSENPAGSGVMEQADFSHKMLEKIAEADNTLNKMELDSPALPGSEMSLKQVATVKVQNAITLSSNNLTQEENIVKDGPSSISSSHADARAESVSQQPEIRRINEASPGMASLVSSSSLEDNETAFQQFLDLNEKEFRKRLAQKPGAVRPEFNTLEGRIEHYRKRFYVCEQAKKPPMEERNLVAEQQKAELVFSVNAGENGSKQHVEASKSEVEEIVAEPTNSLPKPIFQNMQSPTQVNDNPPGHQPQIQNLTEPQRWAMPQQLHLTELQGQGIDPVELNQTVHNNMAKLIYDFIPSDSNFIANHYANDYNEMISINSIKNILKPDAPLLGSTDLARADFLNNRTGYSEYAMQEGDELRSDASSVPEDPSLSPFLRSQPNTAVLLQAASHHTNFNAHLRTPALSFGNALKDFEKDIDRGPACDCASSDPVRLARRRKSANRPSVQH